MKKDNLIIGIFLVIIGVITFGNQNNFWDINIFFKGWWTLFLIIPSIIIILKKDFVTGISGLIIGVIMLLSVNNIIEFVSIWPIFIVIIGLSLIFGNNKKKETKSKNKYIAIFSGSEDIVNDNFKGTDITAVFGGVDLNLKKSEITEDVNISCLCLFGGIDIIVPDNVVVKVKGFPIFGCIENKVNVIEGKVVFINATCLFGGITIR